MSMSALGDTLLASAIAQDIRRYCQDASIIFFCGSTNQAAAELLPEVDRIVCLPIGNPVAAIRLLRANRVDLLLDLSPWARLPALFARFAAAGQTVGFRTAGQYRHYAYDVFVEHSSKLHEVDNYRRLAAAAGISTGSQPSIVPRNHGPRRPFRSDGTYVVFHAFASGNQAHLREWPAERWVELGVLVARAGHRVVLTAASADRVRAQSLLAALRTGGVPADLFESPGKSLEPVLGVLVNAAAVVSVNTGTMHLASLAGAPTLALNGPTSDTRWGPRGPRSASVNPQGSGCGYLNLGFECDGRPQDCMERISVEQVMAELEKLLSRPAAQPAPGKYRVMTSSGKP